MTVSVLLSLTGWTDTYCAVPCPAGMFGENCGERSECVKGSSHQEQGDCVCSPGYEGVRSGDGRWEALAVGSINSQTLFLEVNIMLDPFQC